MLYFASLDNIAQQKLDRSSRPEVLGKATLEIYARFTGEHLCRSVISIEITLWHKCSPANLLHNFRTAFPKNTSRRLFLIRL